MYKLHKDFQTPSINDSTDVWSNHHHRPISPHKQQTDHEIKTSSNDEQQQVAQNPSLKLFHDTTHVNAQLFSRRGFGRSRANCCGDSFQCSPGLFNDWMCSVAHLRFCGVHKAAAQQLRTRPNRICASTPMSNLKNREGWWDFVERIVVTQLMMILCVVLGASFGLKKNEDMGKKDSNHIFLKTSTVKYVIAFVEKEYASFWRNL